MSMRDYVKKLRLEQLKADIGAIAGATKGEE